MAALPTPPTAGPALAELRIGADPGDISQATRWLGALADAEGWPQAMRFALELSVEEALANLVMHAFAGAGHPPQVRIECHRGSGGRVVLVLIDNGVPFDPTALPEPAVPGSLEEAKIGGHGGELMRHFLESLSYAREGEENRLTLVAAPPAGEPL